MQPKAIALVGPGRLGRILAEQLIEAGYAITEIISRNNSRSLKRARLLADKVNAEAAMAKRARLNADIVWFCVPDAKIAMVAREFASRDWRGKIALHSSGVLTSDVMSMLRQRGANVVSVHPLMTFVDGSRPSLAGVPFAIEGDPVARRAAGQIARALGGQVFCIRSKDKVAYHAFATMICPLLISVLAASEKVAKLAYISKGDVRRRMIPIVRQTLANYERFGAAASFSGPIVRGDVETIAQHLAVLNKVPAAKAAYSALVAAALEYLPVKNRVSIINLLARKTQTTRRNGKDIRPGRTLTARRR